MSVLRKRCKQKRHFCLMGGKYDPASAPLFISKCRVRRAVLLFSQHDPRLRGLRICFQISAIHLFLVILFDVQTTYVYFAYSYILEFICNLLNNIVGITVDYGCRVCCAVLSSPSKFFKVYLVQFLQMACCVGTSACSLCCSACPTTRNSTTTRIMYAIMLFVGTIFACVMLSPGFQKLLVDVRRYSLAVCPFQNEWFCQGLDTVAGLKCERAVGFQAVYRCYRFCLKIFC